MARLPAHTRGANGPTGNPPQGAGNYAGVEVDDGHWPEQFGWIEGYNGRYARNRSGGIV